MQNGTFTLVNNKKFWLRALALSLFPTSSRKLETKVETLFQPPPLKFISSLITIIIGMSKSILQP